MKIHPNDALLCAVLLRSKGSKKVLEHIDQCSQCQARFALRASADRFHRADYGPAFERSYQILEQRQAALAQERGEAPQLVARLIGLVPERQQLLLHNSRRFQTWGLFELLLLHGENETFKDPWHAEEIFRLALEVSAHLNCSLYGRERIEDLRARTWAFIGNARRSRMDLSASEEAFEEASGYLQMGTEDILEGALLFYAQASLRRAQSRYEEAARLSTRAIRVFKKAGERHQVGRTLVKLATIHLASGHFQEALAVLPTSFDWFDPVREPRLALCTLHNTADALSSAGYFMKAQRAVAQTQPLYRRFPEPQVQSRRRWVEAKIAYGLGRYQEADALMVVARDGFLSAHATYDAELASRELASIRAHAGGKFDAH